MPQAVKGHAAPRTTRFLLPPIALRYQSARIQDLGIKNMAEPSRTLRLIMFSLLGPNRIARTDFPSLHLQRLQPREQWLGQRDMQYPACLDGGQVNLVVIPIDRTPWEAN